MNNDIISWGVYKRLLISVFGIFLVFSLLSSLILYNSQHMPAGLHYAAAHSVMPRIRESLITKTVLINLIFSFMAAVGVSILGVFYSHRIAGPLVKLKQHARVLSNASFDERIFFRKKDALQPLANVLNEVAVSFQEKTGRLASQLREIEDTLESCRSLPDGAPETGVLIKRLLDLDTKIKKTNQEMEI